MNIAALHVEKPIAERAHAIEHEFLKQFFKQADYAFAVLLIVQWLAGIGLALWLTPKTWLGQTSAVHVHVWAAVFLGGIIALPVAALAVFRSGHTSTRYCIAVAQMLAAALLIHLTGGRVETHFHIFGSLAFLAFYRDWKVLIVASAVVTVDHILRDLYWPMSIFGTDVVSHWRWVEHAWWVVFEDIFLIYSVGRSRALIHEYATKRAETEIIAERIEQAVVARTRDLADSNARLQANIEERQRVALELKSAKDAADAASRAKSEFLANMSHEIRTPMNGVMGMTSLLLDTSLSTQQRGFADTIRQSCDALLVVINDILDFSKIESGKMELEEQPFDLRSCVEDTLDLFSPKAAEKRIDLGYMIAEGTPTHLVGDYSRLRQILVNLLGNGIKFTDTGSVLARVTSQAIGPAAARASAPPEIWHGLQFEIRDTGIGIPSERLDRLFKQFSQVDTSMTRRYGGTGLGLAIVKSLCEIMGGRIWVESEEGKGSTFFFTVRMRASGRPHAPMPELPLLREKTLLVVDDGAVNRRILQVQAQRWGMHCQEADSGAAALEWLRQGNRADVAILDMQMPEMDGLDLALRIQELELPVPLPLILLSSATMAYDREDPRWLLFAARFNKPVKLIPLRDSLLMALGHVQYEKAVVAAPKPRLQLAAELPLRVHLAEDNPVNQKVASRMLEALGYRCDIASNGREAVASALRQPYDLIFMDVQMPELDGYAATQEIQRVLEGRDRPQIIALTAHASAQDRELCLANGMDDYLTKPLVPALLDQKIRDAAARLGRLPMVSA